MSQVFTIGRVTADFELKTSQKKNHYVRFSLAENIGYGQNTKTQYLQVWARGVDAENLAKANVKKGSLIWVSGSIELEEFMKQNGILDKRLKITLNDWGFVLSRKPGDEKSQVQYNDESGTKTLSDGIPSGGEIDGDRNDLPD